MTIEEQILEALHSLPPEQQAELEVLSFNYLYVGLPNTRGLHARDTDH